MVVAHNELTGTKNADESLAIFDGHGDAAVRREVHHPMEHIQGFTQSHWMPPSGECLRRIAPAAAMVDDFEKTHKTLTKHNF